MPDRHIILSKFFFSIHLVALILIPQDSHATDLPFNPNPQSYVLNILNTHEIVFLGTRHKQPPILNIIADLIPKLKDSGATHIGLEIESDQQDKIDQYMKTGAGLNNIQLHPQIDCPEYRNLFKMLRGLEPKKRPPPVALDLPNSKMLVVVGNNHVLKKLDWQDQVANKHRSIREYLSGKRRKLRAASIGQVIGKSVYEGDFRREFGHIDGAVAIDLDERYAGWKLGIVESVAIKPAEVWELLDGVVVYRIFD